MRHELVEWYPVADRRYAACRELRNFGAQDVLHMECQWLEHLDAAVIEPRISAADLVLGCDSGICADMPPLSGMR